MRIKSTEVNRYMHESMTHRPAEELFLDLDQNVTDYREHSLMLSARGKTEAEALEVCRREMAKQAILAGLERVTDIQIMNLSYFPKDEGDCWSGRHYNILLAGSGWTRKTR